MDLSALVADLTSKTADLTNTQRDLEVANAKVAELSARIPNLEAEATELRTQLDAAKAANPTADLEAATATRDAAVAALSEVAKGLLTKTGKLNVTLPTEVAELSAFIQENSASLVLKPNGTSKDAISDLSSQPDMNVASSFRRAK